MLLQSEVSDGYKLLILSQIYEQIAVKEVTVEA